jgi:hypothetical protein
MKTSSVFIKKQLALNGILRVIKFESKNRKHNFSDTKFSLFILGCGKKRQSFGNWVVDRCCGFSMFAFCKEAQRSITNRT